MSYFRPRFLPPWMRCPLPVRCWTIDRCLAQAGQAYTFSTLVETSCLSISFLSSGSVIRNPLWVVNVLWRGTIVPQKPHETVD